MASEKFFSPVTTLIHTEDIPEQLGFIRDGITNLLSHVYFRDFQFSKSPKGDVAFYSLSIVSKQRLDIEIAGTGIFLILNPSHVLPTDISEFPITISYEWPILAYVRGFDLSQFSFAGGAFFDTALKVFGVNQRQVIEETLNAFLPGPINPAITDFVNKVNAHPQFAGLLPMPTSGDPIGELVTLIETNLGTNAGLVVFTIFLIDSFSDGNTTENLNKLFRRVVGPDPVGYLKKLIIPKLEVTLQLAVGIEFPRNMLVPLGTNGLPLPETERSILSFATPSPFKFSTETGIGYDQNIAVSLNHPSQIGNTGLKLNFTNAKIDFSRTVNIPEADLDGRPADFVGFFAENVTIELPKGFANSSTASTTFIKGHNLLIGTGGISGTIGLDSPNGIIHQKLGNVDIFLNSVFMKFHQNAIVDCIIKGGLIVPGFKDSLGNPAQIDIDVLIKNDGDFRITAKEKDGILIRLPNVLDIVLKSVSVGQLDDRFFLEISGTVTMTFSIPALTFDRPIAFEMKKMIIWEDGKIEIIGGSIILPQALTLKIGPVKLSITAISMGSYERGGRPYKYFGFDGGVNVNPGGVDVRASGVKVYYSTDNLPLDIFVRVEGIAIDLIIPGSKSADEATVLISGFLQMKEPDSTNPNSNAGTEYAGGVSFKLPKAGIGGSAAMRINPSIPNFIVDTELSISVPIPLGNTSLGIYGFRGLIGLRYVADRAYPPLGLAPDASWYEYYKKKVALSYKEGINIDKFNPRNGFAIGAGITLGTLTDSGKAFSAKLFLLLSLPDALLLQGQAAIMAERVDLSPNDPPFSVLIAITKQSVEAAFGVNYKLPQDTGAIVDVNALIEMGFFFQDSSAWYINVGRDQPESKRVTARILTLFDAWTYLMLSASGIRAGAGAKWDFVRNFGPVGLEAHAYIDVQGRISFKPKQIGGAIQLGGSVALKVFKFKLGLSIAASLAAEAPKPFIVTGSVTVHLDLPKPFKKFGGDFHVEFTWTFDPNLDVLPVAVFNEASISEASKSVNIATRERFELNVPASPAMLNSPMPPAPTSGWINSFDDHVVALDCTIDVEFKKPIAPSSTVTNIGTTGTGYVNSEYSPPQKGKSPQVQHNYTVQEVKIRSWNPSTNQWQDYDIYNALTPLQDASFIDPADLIGLKQGWWQTDQPNKVNKLSLLSQTPLSYVNDTAGPFIPENSGVTAEDIFCPEDEIIETCIAVDDFPQLTVLPADTTLTVQSLQIRITGEDGAVIPVLNPFGFTKGLILSPESQLEIFFPELTSHISLKMSTLADNLSVFYMRRIQTGVNSSNQPTYTYQVVKQEVLNSVNLLQKIIYDDINEPIDKVVIIAGKCRCIEEEDPCECCDDDQPVGTSTATVSQTGSTRGNPRPVPVPAEQVPSTTTGDQNRPVETPLCGSIAAYLLETCESAHQLVAQFQKEYETLLAQAAEKKLLCEKFSQNQETQNIAKLYCHEADELLEEAEKLQEQIQGLLIYIEYCERFSRSTGFEDRFEHATPVVETKAKEMILLDPRNPGEGAGYEQFDLTCKTIIFQVCWLSLSSQLFNSTIPTFEDVLNNNTAMVTAINNTIQPIWRPDTIFAVSIKVVDNVIVAANGINTSQPRYMHMGFRTKGPIGHFHQERAEFAELESQDRADQFRLQSLKPYIDFSKSYPNADGNILNAKPLFYVNPKLQMFYNKPYIYTMYGGTFDAYNGNPALTSTLAASILDPINPLPAPTDPGFVGPVSLNFIPNNLGQVPLDIQMLNNMATQSETCTEAGENGIAPIGIQSNTTVDQLKPLKLYLAVYKADYNGTKEEVHRYNFQTSRYADFPEQVNSYKLKDRDNVYVKDAIFDDISVTLDSTRLGQLTALLNNTYPSGDPLEQEYADPFDRLIDGILQTGPIDPPVGTDFNIIRDSVSGDVMGILLRNPEPFNDPKIPPSDIAVTITLSQNGGPTTVFSVIHSKDRSRAFIGNANLNITLADLKFTFKYLEYNGAVYTVASTVVVNLFVTPPPPPPPSSL